MKQLVKTTKAFVRSAKPKPKVEGFVELLTHEKFEGWAIHREQKPLTITLQVKGQEFTLSPQWHRRDDVMAAHGQSHHSAGFSVQWPDKVRNMLTTEKLNKADLKIKAANTELKITGPLPEPDLKSSITAQQEQETAKKPKRKTDPRLEPIFVQNNDEGEVVAVIDSFDKFLIRGHLVSDQETAPKLAIVANQQEQEWPVLWQSEESDLEERDTSAQTQHRFEIEVPGYAWERNDGGKADDIEIVLSAEGYEKFPPITLSREKALQWLHQISLLTDESKLQYYGLVAVEHLRFSGLRRSLDPRTAAFYQQFAERMQLEDFMQAGQGPSDDINPPIDYVVDFETQLLWKAQKALNQKIIQKPEKIYDSVVEVVREQKLIGNVKKNFLQSIVPLLAKNHQLFKLKQLIDFREFYALDHSDNAWAVSLAVAPLMADKQIGRATDTLWRLAKMLDKGWLNTECIWFAVRHVQALEEQGEATYTEAEKVRYAVISVLDAMGGDWFSRLHDAMLQQAVVDMLNKRHLMTDYQMRDVISAAIRHYALSPDFWKKIQGSGLVSLSDSLFQRARKYWLVVESAFTSTENLPGHWQAVQQALNFFERQGNPEAVYMRRELIASLLPDPNMEQDELLELILEAVADDPMEAVRYAAHPMIQESTAERLLEAYRTEIPEALRLNTERASSVTYQAQMAVADELAHGKLDADALVSLHNWPAMFLSVDMLTSAIAKKPEAIDEHLPLLDHYMQQVIAQSAPTYWLPAPVCAALANLNQLAPRYKQLGDWLAQIKVLLTARFGDRHDSLFEPKPKVVADEPLTSPGWPRDTLVVIYSCRAYLDTRIKAIRETWLRDLKARNIPYVILVGDGDDKLNDDVLELNVSDTYEDLPYKTLKLFDWVYQNTNAQYVLKVDDDCYLDVNSYFDLLSYRKHHYYGRVVDKGLGGTTRDWHHEKSNTKHAKKSLDKSPDPSKYADGGGGYTLSRVSIAELLKHAKTMEGIRLVAQSYMEDKLIGDLLRLSEIGPNNEDYECYQRRRTFNKAITIGRWENIFFPSKSNRTLIAHLDSSTDQSLAHSKKDLPGLWPKKLWPSCWDLTIRENSNQLELITEHGKASRILQEPIIVVGAFRNEMIMVPHFLKHYRRLGVKAFLITDNCSDDGTREYLNEQNDVVLYSADTEYRKSQYGVAWQQAMLANHCCNKWALIADADELLVYDGWQSSDLMSLVARADEENADCIRTDMVDMYPKLDLIEADFTTSDPFNISRYHDKQPLLEWSMGSGWFSNTRNWTSSLRHRLDKNSDPSAYVSQKFALIRYKPWMRLSQGVHYSANTSNSTEVVAFAHFKYHAHFKQKVEEEVRRKQHYDGAKEYRRYLSLLAEATGAFYRNGVSIELAYKDAV